VYGEQDWTEWEVQETILELRSAGHLWGDRGVTGGQMPEERWLTYAEAAQLLGRSTEAIRALVRREKWPRRIPNDYGSPTLILVPDDRLPPTVNGGQELADGGSESPSDSSYPPLNGGGAAMNGGHELAEGGSEDEKHQGGHRPSDRDADQEHTIPVILLTMKQMIEGFRADVVAANERAERAERRAEDLQASLDRKEAEHRAERDRLVEEVAEHRRITAVLADELRARQRRWWRWRR
jgi:hypothetical protein